MWRLMISFIGLSNYSIGFQQMVNGLIEIGYRVQQIKLQTIAMFSKAVNFLDKVSHNLSQKEGEDGWTHICGGVDGKPYEFINNKYMLVGVRGRNEQYINALQFLFVDTQTGQFQETPEVGGTGGQMFTVTCPTGQYITKAFIWSGNVIDAVQFETNMGQKSGKFGGNGGSIHTIDASGRKICGVKGRSGSLVNQLCFGVTK